MGAKFKVGDRVRFVTTHPKKKPPQDILDGYRRRSRPIIGAYYDPTDKCTYYEFRDIPGLFRSYSLKLATPEDLHTRGAPRQKRKWHKKQKRLATKGIDNSISPTRIEKRAIAA